MTREMKAGAFHVKAIDGRKVTGIYSVYGNLDDYSDKIWPGAMAKTIAERGSKILHLWQHDFSCPPIAKIISLREVGRDELPEAVLAQAPEAMGGAEVTREYLKTPRADEVLANLTAGVPLQMSFAYDALKYDYEALPGAKYEWERMRNLREIRLWETSDVLWGANDATIASKAALPLDYLLKQFMLVLDELRENKDGRRNSAADQTRINTIAKIAIELGADNVELLVAPLDDADKTTPATPSNLPTPDASRAEADAASLTPAVYQYKLQLAQRQLALLQRSVTP